MFDSLRNQNYSLVNYPNSKVSLAVKNRGDNKSIVIPKQKNGPNRNMNSIVSQSLKINKNLFGTLHAVESHNNLTNMTDS